MHRGSFPLYSGNTTRIFDEIDSFDYNIPCISWAIDGLAGYIMCHDSPFSATNHRGVLLPKHSDVDIGYAKSTLEPIFRELKKGRIGDRGQNEYTSLPPFMIADVTFDIPVDSDGNICLDAQREFTKRYEALDEIKNELRQQCLEIYNYNIAVDFSSYNMHEVPLANIIDPVRGKSIYTKKYGDSHNGEYPVYSASANKPLTSIDTFDYDGSYLSWSTNGFAGTVTILSGKFSINGDRGILLPKRDDIDIEYLKYILHPIFRRLAKGRKGDRGVDEFTKLYPSMIKNVGIPFPFDDDGSINFDEQKEIAKTYATVEKYKREIIDKLNLLLEQNVSFED